MPTTLAHVCARVTEAIIMVSDAMKNEERSKHTRNTVGSFLQTALKEELLFVFNECKVHGTELCLFPVVNGNVLGYFTPMRLPKVGYRCLVPLGSFEKRVLRLSVLLVQRVLRLAVFLMESDLRQSMLVMEAQKLGL